MINAGASMADTGTKLAGWTLVGASAATMLVMSHHPTSAHQGTLNQLVHGAMIALTGATAFGFFHWSRLRGLARPSVSAGLIAYGIALFGHIGAALMNGFVLTALVHDGAGDGAWHALVWEMNQALARLGAFATGAAYAFWSLDLLRRGDAIERVVGVLGLLAGLVPPALLAAGVLTMNLAGALIVYGTAMAWMAVVGLMMLRAAAARNLRD